MSPQTERGRVPPACHVYQSAGYASSLFVPRTCYEMQINRDFTLSPSSVSIVYKNAPGVTPEAFFEVPSGIEPL